MNYDSTVLVPSRQNPQVVYKIARMSFGRRLELTRQVRELSRKISFLDAGQDPAGKIEAAMLAREIDRLYLRWGLAGVEGLFIDGQPAGPEELIEKGPEDLCLEALAAIKAECGLSEEDRKN